MIGRQVVTYRPAGVVMDAPAYELPATVWSRVQNVRLRDGASQSVQMGEAAYGDFPQPPLFAQTQAGAVYADVGYASQDQIGVVDVFGVHADITPTPAPAPQSPYGWFGCVIGGVMVFANSDDVPVYYPGSDLPCEPLPGWFDNERPLGMEAFGTRLMALGTTAVRDLVRASASAIPGQVPQEWTPSPTNDAADVPLVDQDGPILAGGALGNEFMVYKAHATYAIREGGPFAIAKRNVSGQFGALSRWAWCEVQGSHVIVSDGDVLIHDGRQGRSIANSRMRRTLFNALGNPKTLRLVYASERGELQLYFGGQQDGLTQTRCFTYSFKDDGWGEFALQTPSAHVWRGYVPAENGRGRWSAQTLTWANSVGSWIPSGSDPTRDGTLACVGAGMQTLDDGQEAAGPAGNGALWEKLSFAAAEDITPRVLRYVTLHADGEGDTMADVRVGEQEQATEPVYWHPPITVKVSQNQRGSKVWLPARGRYLSIQIAAREGRPVRVHGFTLETVNGGG